MVFVVAPEIEPVSHEVGFSGVRDHTEFRKCQAGGRLARKTNRGIGLLLKQYDADAQYESAHECDCEIQRHIWFVWMSRRLRHVEKPDIGLANRGCNARIASPL